ncbi:MAG: AtpZ/AtpI family protein [Bacillota bacterium]|nr:AtpZ/AtpI family protein [Bacillota bacterium]
MKHKFVKHLNRTTEIMEIGMEDTYTYVHYKKGSIEQTACVLKNGDITLESYFEKFFKENKVSEEMRKDVRKLLKNEKYIANFHWKEFTNFLMKTLSLHMVFGLTVALSVFLGYKLGDYLDTQFGLYPLFTALGFFVGIGIGGLTGYTMVQKYFIPAVKAPEPKKILSTLTQEEVDKLPIIDITVDDVRRAVRKFSDSLPKGVYRTILVRDDNGIDFTQLAHILKGVPSKPFYMSKETYDLFEESEKLIAQEMDLVQKAVDLYVKEQRDYPMLKFDPQRRVNYYQLISDHYLKSSPQTQFYITDLDGMITHIKPKKTKEGSPQE